MKTRDEVFKEYEEALAKAGYEFKEAKKIAKAKLNTDLDTIRDALHEELKAVRDIQQRKGIYKYNNKLCDCIAFVVDICQRI